MEELVTISHEKPELLMTRSRETFWLLVPMMMTAGASTEAAK